MDEIQSLVMRINTGKYLYHLRKLNSNSLADCGNALDISGNYLGEIERGIKLPSDQLIIAIAKFYSIEENDLFFRFGKIPFSIRQDIEQSTALQKLLSKINSGFSQEQKEIIYGKLSECLDEIISTLR